VAKPLAPGASEVGACLSQCAPSPLREESVRVNVWPVLLVNCMFTSVALSDSSRCWPSCEPPCGVDLLPCGCTDVLASVRSGVVWICEAPAAAGTKRLRVATAAVPVIAAQVWN
jgi:hypothetical protein